MEYEYVVVVPWFERPMLPPGGKRSCAVPPLYLATIYMVGTVISEQMIVAPTVLELLAMPSVA